MSSPPLFGSPQAPMQAPFSPPNRGRGVGGSPFRGGRGSGRQHPPSFSRGAGSPTSATPFHSVVPPPPVFQPTQSWSSTSISPPPQSLFPTPVVGGQPGIAGGSILGAAAPSTVASPSLLPPPPLSTPIASGILGGSSAMFSGRGRGGFPKKGPFSGPPATAAAPPVVTPAPVSSSSFAGPPRYSITGSGPVLPQSQATFAPASSAPSVLGTAFPTATSQPTFAAAPPAAVPPATTGTSVFSGAAPSTAASSNAMASPVAPAAWNAATAPPVATSSGFAALQPRVRGDGSTKESSSAFRAATAPTRVPVQPSTAFGQAAVLMTSVLSRTSSSEAVPPTQSVFHSSERLGSTPAAVPPVASGPTQSPFSSAVPSFTLATVSSATTTTAFKATNWATSGGSDGVSSSLPVSSIFSTASPEQGTRADEKDTSTNRRRERSSSPLAGVPPSSAFGSTRERKEDCRGPGAALPLPRSQQQQQQQQQQRGSTRSAPHIAPTRSKALSITPSQADEKQFALASRVGKVFFKQVLDSNAAQREESAALLEQVYFGVAGREGVYGNFEQTASELLAQWAAVSATASASIVSMVPGEIWVALFALGAYINVILAAIQSDGGAALTERHDALAGLHAYKEAIRANRREALTDACHYANEMGELLLLIFQRGTEADAPPYSIIPVVLRCIRSVLDESMTECVSTVQSNLNTIASKLFAILNRRVKALAIQPGEVGGGSTKWLLVYDSKTTENLIHCFAHLIIEMIAVDAPRNDDVEAFTTAFHASFPSALAERCMLYYRRACALLRQPLTMQLVSSAAELLAQAIVVYPPDAAPTNKRVILMKLMAAELALGRLPSDDDRLALDLPQFTDFINALKTSRMDLYDAALTAHAPFLVEMGIYNTMLAARERISLLMVVKFYISRGGDNRLSVPELITYFNIPYSVTQAKLAWLLPLLIKKQMNGVLDRDYLILSGKAPFDDYEQQKLLASRSP